MPPYNPPQIWSWGGRWYQPPISLDIKEDEENNVLNDFKVGCDPEFGLIDASGNVIYASIHFPSHTDPIGCDHNGRLAEFHPEPTKGVYPIIRKIQALVNSPKIQALNLKLRAGALCKDDTLGGHVHFGFKSFDNPCHGYGVREGYPLNERGIKVAKALDALTRVLEHLDILPKNECATRRTRASAYGLYGRFGDVRDCNGHTEYRTMASWLYDPKVAFLCLTAAKLAAVDPEGTVEALKDCTSFSAFEDWLNRYKTKDLNARRASEKLLEKGLPYLQVDPEVDFKGRWEELGI